MRSEVLNTLIEEGGLVAFKTVKGDNDKQRELVYYHLKQLVKDGIVIKESDGDGDTLYRCDPSLYDNLSMEIAIMLYKLIIDRTGSIELANELIEVAKIRAKPRT